MRSWASGGIIEAQKGGSVTVHLIRSREDVFVQVVRHILTSDTIILSLNRSSRSLELYQALSLSW